MAQVTLKHVSEAAGVSVQTVSQILNPRYKSRYNPQTRRKVMQSVRALGYRPNAAARAMLKGKSHIIGVLVPIVSGGWFFQHDVFETMLGMNERLSHEGYVTSVIPVRELQQKGVSRVFREQLLDGLVVIGWIPEDIAQFIEEVASVCIWCDTNIDRPKGCIRREELQAGRMVAEHALAAGYQRIIWITYDSPSDHYSSRDRRAGVEEIARSRGVPIDTVRATRSWITSDPASFTSQLRADTAVITENMHFAQSVANLAQTCGLAPGKDFGLAACDHSDERAAVFPDLSRVVIRRTDIGEQMANMMLAAVASGTLPDSARVRGTWFAGQTLPGSST